jgi:hypothetical protein
MKKAKCVLLQGHPDPVGEHLCHCLAQRYADGARRRHNGNVPAWIYRLVYSAHGVRGLNRNVLSFLGIRPVRTTMFGLVEAVSPQTREASREDLGAAHLRFPGRRVCKVGAREA